MDCLKDYIGIRHCSQEAPKSGLYLNNLAGMSTELADKIANSEQVNFLGVWEDVQTVAHQRFVQDFQMYLNKEMGTGFNKTLYQTQRLTKPRAYEILEPSAVYRGVYVYLPISRFVKFDLKSVQMFIKDVEGGAFDGGFDDGFDTDSSDLNAQLKIWDLQAEKLLQVVDVVLQQGLNTFELNLEFDISTEAIELFIGIDTTKITTIKTHENLYNWYDGDCEFNGSWAGTISGEHWATISPATMALEALPLYENIGFTGIGQGIAIDAQVSCSIEQFLCENKKYLHSPLLYVLGSQMLAQKLASNVGSSRVNWFTHGNLEQTLNTKTMFDAEYDKAMKNAVKSLNIPDSGICFACNESASAYEGGQMP